VGGFVEGPAAGFSHPAADPAGAAALIRLACVAERRTPRTT
jgi:hypothetical protein